MLDRNAVLVAGLAGSLLSAVPFGGTERHQAPRPPAEFAAAPAAAASSAHCCFVNPRFVGTCDVEPSADETCGSILAYLNNPQSQGKTYCGSTSIRGGWKPAACEGKTSRE